MITLPGSTRAERASRPSTSVTASGPYTVVIHLKHAVHAADRDARLPDGGVSCRRRSSPSSARTSRPIRSASGPFMFDHRVVGDNVTVIKSPYYYDQDAVHLDKIVFKPMPDAAAAAAALQAGRHPGARPGLADGAAGIQQNTGLRVLHANGLGWRGHHHQHRQQERRRQPARTRTSARRSRRARSCGRRSRRRSTGTR